MSDSIHVVLLIKTLNYEFIIPRNKSQCHCSLLYNSAHDQNTVLWVYYPKK